MRKRPQHSLHDRRTFDSCCRKNMDSYEDFCARILSNLQSEMLHQKSCSPVPVQRGAQSFISFHDRPVLSPLLNEKQMREVAEYKKRAIQLEAKRQIYYKNNLVNQIQNILWTSKAPKVLDVPDSLEQHDATKTEQNNGYAVHGTAKLTPGEGTEPFILTSEPPVSPSAVSSEAIKAKIGEEKQAENKVEAEEVSLQHLLKKSREFIEKEQGRQGSKFISINTVDPKVMPPESPLDKENISSLDVSGSCLTGYLPSGYSPSQSSPGPLISPEPNVTVRPHRGRPRPISACSIFFYPDNPNQPSTTATGTPQDALIPNRERRLLGAESSSSNRCDGTSWFSPLSETLNTKESLETSPVDPKVISPLFRRRCHTLDSQQSPLIDRTQQRMPRFMAGVTARTPLRVSPTSPMSQSYTRESPLCVFMESDLTPGSPSHGHLSFEIEGKSVIGQGGLSPVAGEDGCELRAVGERYTVLTPVCSLSPGDGSSWHSASSIGSPSNSLEIPSPSKHASIYIQGLNYSGRKTRNRLSQVLTADQQRALCHLCAIVKGFLTRRLLKTEKVKHLCQTVQDTQEFIHSFGGGQMSEQDFSLQERVRAQLRAALFDIHDIFFTMPLEERLFLLQLDRDLRTERKLREMEKARTSKDKMILSAATQKSLDRKKQRVGESPGPTRKAQKTKSPPAKRILQPSQGQNALVSGQQLLCRGHTGM
ncbi:centriolar coiled-coil protein of 110 kDa-like isoform X2 [Triplophysa dalaica]|uniref:centriolar coiled-coil protein of 110 kDa-like isoform X2 n=1 Tax=Triplophysa dalaica TaxID=1582913 RepID=UPI0024DF331B|nr:centriolar coiled-coil protein of 110 kDa-like isoform X2 [Triplophysa dalaica]